MRNKLLALTMIVGMGAGLLGFNANSAQAAAAKKITLNDAKQIALKHAKLTAKQVKFIKAKSDIENGKKVYDIEFYKGNTEYDYEISATTGKILEYDHDVENFKAPIQKTKISLSKAMKNPYKNKTKKRSDTLLRSCPTNKRDTLLFFFIGYIFCWL